MSPGVYEDTVRLEVPVDDTHVVEVLQGQHHLPGVELHHPLREFVPLSETPEDQANVLTKLRLAATHKSCSDNSIFATS